jgi:hypothetical protein
MHPGSDPLARVLARIEKGARVTLGGGRWHQTFSHRDGGWYVEEFDEGAEYAGRASEDEIRKAFALSPAPFLALLGEPFWEQFASALVAGDRARARTLLAHAPGYPARDAAVLGAFLAWPEEAPSAEVRELLARAIRDQAAPEIFRAAVLQRHGDAVARQGVAFLGALAEMTGAPLHCFAQRAGFRIMAGDIDGAIEDFQRELDRLPANADERSEEGRARRDHLRWIDELRARPRR